MPTCQTFRTVPSTKSYLLHATCASISRRTSSARRANASTIFPSHRLVASCASVIAFPSRKNPSPTSALRMRLEVPRRRAPPRRRSLLRCVSAQPQADLRVFVSPYSLAPSVSQLVASYHPVVYCVFSASRELEQLSTLHKFPSCDAAHPWVVKQEVLVSNSCYSVDKVDKTGSVRLSAGFSVPGIQ